MSKIVIPKELINAIRTNIQILHEAIEKDENPGKQISYRKMAGNGSFDVSDHTGDFQLITEICVDRKYFLEDGDIQIITERPHDPEPYKVRPAEGEALEPSKVLTLKQMNAYWQEILVREIQPGSLLFSQELVTAMRVIGAKKMLEVISNYVNSLK